MKNRTIRAPVVGLYFRPVCQQVLVTFELRWGLGITVESFSGEKNHRKGCLKSITDADGPPWYL